MNDKRIKMDCPFCHTSAREIQLVVLNDRYGEIRCPNCGAKFTGSGKQNLIDSWNRR